MCFRGIEKKLDKKFLISIILFSAIMFFISLFPINKIYLWDEAVYLSTAENLFKPDPYYSEISYRPPLLPLLIKIGSVLFDINIIAHILISLFFVLGIISLYLLGKEVFNEKTGFIAGIFFGTSPFLLHISTKIMTDITQFNLFIKNI